MNFKSLISKAYHILIHKKEKFHHTINGLYICKYDHLYKWDDIYIINGYLKWIATSDIVKIEIIFMDGRKLVYDDGYSAINYLMDEVLAKNLYNFKNNWYSEVISLVDSNEPFVIYKREN